MKNIFRRSVQIFHKKDKDKSGNSDSDGSSRDSSRGGSNNDLNVNGIHSGSNSSKKDKKSKRHSKNYDAKHSDVSASSESPQSSLRGSPAIYSQKQQQQQPIPQVIVSKPSARRVFGVPLHEVPCRDDSNVPIIVEKLVDHLEYTALSTEGLFRIPGRDVTIMEFVRLFDNFEEVDVSSLEPYTAAGLLKRFFRDLPVFVPPQINKMVASLFVAEDGKKKQIDMEILERLRYLVHCLPPVHFEVMQSLTSLLSKLLLKSEENKMTVTNIAICLVPTLNCVPAIVTYPIQYHDFFFKEPFAEHHVPSMRPVLNNFLSLEEKPELVTEMQKRYSRSRPASISISGLLPSNQPPNQQSSPSSSTITSTTITSPHDSVTPITFTVTTTYLDQLQQQLQQQQQIQQQQQEQQQQQHQHNLERRKAKLTAEDLQYQQFIEENQFLKNQYAQQPQQINQQPLQLQQQQQQLQVPNDNSSNGSNSNTNINKYYRRSVAFGTANSNSNSINSNNNLVSDVASESGLQSPNMLNNSNGMMINNSITKANIQQLKEKIDRYSKEKMRELRESTQSMSMRRGDMGATLSNLNPQAAVGSSTTQTSTTSTNTSGAIEKDKERDKLLRYSVDFERFKERHQKEMAEKRCSRDISREIERELEKRLSPRERISMLLSNNNNNNNNNIGGSLSGQSNRIGDRESRSFRYSVSSQNQYNLSNIMNNGGGKTYGNSSRDSGNYNRYSKDYRYSRELDNEELDFLSRQQRSQSCFDDNIPRNGSSTSINNNYENTQYQSILLEQKLDKLKETMNNIRTQRDDRTSRDYTLYIRDMDELRASLAKETETSEFFATKSLELVEKLRKEEEKNQKLMEEIQLMESYFALKEKLKRSKRHSISTKEILTRSRSPTLPTNITSTSTTTTTNTSNNNISGSPKEHISLSTSSSSISTSSSNSSTSNNAQLNKDQMMNQLLRGGNSSRKLVNLVQN